jgi:hypothetical protein
MKWLVVAGSMSGLRGHNELEGCRVSTNPIFLRGGPQRPPRYNLLLCCFSVSLLLMAVEILQRTLCHGI